MARGLCHVHKRGFIHRDIAPRNIFLDAEGRAVLGDFGLCRFVDAQGEQALEPTLLPVFLHRCSSNGRVSRKADVYMLGMSLAEIISDQVMLSPLLFASWKASFVEHKKTAEELA